MLVHRQLSNIYFSTDYNENYYLVNAFTNLDGGPISRNNPVEFLMSGLNSKKELEPFDPVIRFSVSTDEAVPCTINGAFIGGGHGQPCGLTVYSPAHGKTLADVGAVYVDQDGINFTLLRIINDDYLLLVSDNVGKSVTHYDFISQIKGNLSYLKNGKNTLPIHVKEYTPRTQICSAIRHINRKFVAIFEDGSEKTFEGYFIECKHGKIIEEYHIINPATISPALQNARPESGFTYTPDLKDFGEPMLNYKMVYNVYEDGTMIMEYELKKLQDVSFDTFMGVMYQEKKDVFGGGIFRHLPKTKPFDTENKHFDFSYPFPLRGETYPTNFSPSKEQWENPDSPPERIVDYFRDKDSNDKLGFACGYLPLFDGVPEVRKNNRTSIFIYKSRKAYPTFRDGNLDSVKGVAYKKFFIPQNRSSVYTIPYGGKKYHYFDFFEDNTLTVSITGKVSLFEKSQNVQYFIENNKLSVKGKKGFACLIEE